MHLIILYGPPASGKLTIAKSVAKKTGFPLLHNHLVADFGNALFSYGTDEYVQLATKLRTMAVDAAIQGNLPGLIMTFAFGLETLGGKNDESVLRDIARRVQKHGGTVHFVHLVASESALIQRVGNADRKIFRKLTKTSILKTILHTFDVQRPISFAESLTLDTSQLSVTASVNKILARIS
jgi:hypothetical protein